MKVKLFIRSRDAFAMLVAILCVLVQISNAYVDAVRQKCSNSSGTTLSFEPSDGKVNGRYTAELCSEVDPNVTQWKLDLSFHEKREFCNPGRRWRPGKQHSGIIEDITFDTKCKNVCFSHQFDLIFSACYAIKSIFVINGIDQRPNDFYTNVNNSFSLAHFKKNEPHVVMTNHDKYVSIGWYPGVPPTEYDIDLCDNSKGMDQVCTTVTNNCTSPDPPSTEIMCPLAPAYGCYKIVLRHFAPWTSGIFYGQASMSFDFCYTEASHPKVSGSSWGTVWACGGVLALCACAGAARALWASRSAAALRKRVLRDWLQQSQTGAGGEVRATGAHAHTLLLYAREGERGARVFSALAALLRHVTQGKVYDIYSAEVMAQAAAAPAEWVARALRAGVAVLCLQTPALACLHAPQYHETAAALRLSAPLLGRRAAYRRPQYGDALLQYALRLAAEAADAQHDYNKYFLATLSGLPTEVFPQLVPYRRYSLPDAWAALLRDLRPDAPDAPDVPDVPPELVRELSEAVDEFVEYVRENPDYLMDELIFM